MKKPTVRFLLEDILEIKYGGDRRLNRKLAADLARNIRGSAEVHPFKGFTLGETLLVIREAGIPAIKRLVLLDPSTSVHLQVNNLRRCAKRFR